MSELDGRYRLESVLGEGGMGTVWRARHLFLDRDVAVKVLRPELSGEPSLQERFLREARLVAQLRAPGVVEVLDSGRASDGRLYLVMELLAGESLAAGLGREGRLDAATTRALLDQLLEVLALAHAAGFIHRDLKPENLWLLPASEGAVPRLKVLDFGIAKALGPQAAAGATQVGMVVGTPAYLAPEQALGQPLDARADLYNVGLLGLVMRAGRHPFPQGDVQQLVQAQAVLPVPRLELLDPSLSGERELSDLLERATRKRADERFPSAEEMRRALLSPAAPLAAPPDRSAETAAFPAATPTQSFEPAQPVAPTSVPPLPLAPTPAPRRGPTALVAAALAGALLLGAGLGISWWRGGPQREAERLLKAGKSEEALSLLEGEGETAAVLWLRGRALHARRKAEQGLERYEAAAKLEPAGVLHPSVLGDLLDDLGGKQGKEAASLLLRGGEPAVRALLEATVEPKSARRRRTAIEALEGAGLGERIDRIGVALREVEGSDCPAVLKGIGLLAASEDPRAREGLEAASKRKVALGLFEGCGVEEARRALAAKR